MPSSIHHCAPLSALRSSGNLVDSEMPFPDVVAGSNFNLSRRLLIVGALWYLLALEHNDICWQMYCTGVCRKDSYIVVTKTWKALSTGIALSKYWYCQWWGL